MDIIKIKRALLSVSDKTNIVPLAKVLANNGCEIISTGGTRKKLEEANIPVTEISKVTKNPEAFSGRMKTISFHIESALLFDREKDAEEAKALGIEPIDLVVCNLYPFAKVLEERADFDTLIENIDIGGPTMIRASAKNFKYVTVLTSPEEYTQFLTEFQQHQGTTFHFRKKQMALAFNHTADYDALIATTMSDSIGEKTRRFYFKNGHPLRYGENSHQAANIYQNGLGHYSLADMKILQGKAISYNNVLDITGAIDSVKNGNRKSCAVIKHSNPCGIAETDNQRSALELAWAGDPISAFGSIISFNTPVRLETVQFFDLDNPDKSKRKFIEVIIAPKFSDEALTYLSNSKNLRVIELDIHRLKTAKEYRMMHGILLEQDEDNALYKFLESKTKKELSIQQHQPLIEFGLQAIKNIKSNSIAIVTELDGQFCLIGMGAGQPNRLIATKLAIDKAKDFIRARFGESPETIEKYLAKAILISDAFFPFADNIELAASEGIQKIVQPGGSIRDKSVIAKCDELGVAMAFSGMRHFKH
ncbi:MAG TPA: bifunctional phosphoribosylaminoimidazolecarboxamide formyltransferase/IMP cyclohydrolase [Saprospiraceae bacterium]|nr:bifunctional phosphoribosylaminoimidazolecarboxamide formyltransferase/IMP cyclohydrolase [Saprospiraceae bacterium]